MRFARCKQAIPTADADPPDGTHRCLTVFASRKNRVCPELSLILSRLCVAESVGTSTRQVHRLSERVASLSELDQRRFDSCGEGGNPDLRQIRYTDNVNPAG
jgi:hypothetical protein